MAAGDYGSLLDYVFGNQGLGPAATALSDVPGAAGALGGSAGGLSGLLGGAGGALGGLSSLLGPIGIAAALGMSIPSLISMFSGRSSTGPGSATADIASGAGGYSDPVIRMLGMGAGALGGNTPVSSPSAGPTYGPYFDASRRLEDLLRWGPGGLTDKKAESLDATTLKNAMTELGNPGTGTGTLNALQQAFQSGGKYLTPDNLRLLQSQESPQEWGITQQLIGQQGGGGGGSTTGQIPTPQSQPNTPVGSTQPQSPQGPGGSTGIDPVSALMTGILPLAMAMLMRPPAQPVFGAVAPTPQAKVNPPVPFQIGQQQQQMA